MTSRSPLQAPAIGPDEERPPLYRGAGGQVKRVSVAASLREGTGSSDDNASPERQGDNAITRRSASVSTKRAGQSEEITREERKRRADAADVLFRETVRRVAVEP